MFRFWLLVLSDLSHKYSDAWRNLREDAHGQATFYYRMQCDHKQWMAQAGFLKLVLFRMYKMVERLRSPRKLDLVINFITVCTISTALAALITVFIIPPLFTCFSMLFGAAANELQPDLLQTGNLAWLDRAQMAELARLISEACMWVAKRADFFQADWDTIFLAWLRDMQARF
jgi:hypothetical protein